MRGASCLLIEQGEGPPDHPRATALNSRSMEFMRRWGIAEAVHEAGTPEDFPHTALYCTTFAGYEIARIERPIPRRPGADRAKPGTPAALQSALSRSDPDRARQELSTTVELRHRCRLELVTEAGDHVLATVHDRANDRHFRSPLATWSIAAAAAP